MNRNIHITIYKFNYYKYFSSSLAKFKISETFHCKQFKIPLFYAKIQKKMLLRPDEILRSNRADLRFCLRRYSTKVSSSMFYCVEVLNGR
jgi:hypothetical protein